ncbi:succinate dehydrogenase cytochrome b558 subunit [Tenuibacillus multivorans]|uniref:Succinate dehydrogenase / fumarate reductase cytochrome b subunit n=1 Tax=Tenuibacillus multivorans TaxID=237069 RepID=A0A1G9ZQC8_9BACI|nr:succinate dehydrogenase cytochrome b558 subunit [Tenuibacillus multivorans]GEL76804.1 succinate dehydrogenase cytochrome b558 subunit [Tenuibacillus multivorans]SDN23297.1 succinate dehydrogenase / fumarate reductase cytochrome b subunit [Tenuibacillus multivorans]
MADNREFFYRRLHSLLGVIPIGLFLMQHLTVNFFSTYGPEAFNNAAGFMENLPLRLGLEIFVIYLPLLFHAIYGVFIAFTAEPNTIRYGFFRNWMFLVQRITGILTLIFIAWHVWETRLANAIYGTEINFDLMASILSDPIMFWFYIIGVVSAVFHFANGLWSFFVTWGLTISPKSQLVMTYITIAIFAVFTYMGISSLIAFAS